MQPLHEMIVDQGNDVMVFQNGLGNPRLRVGILDETNLNRVEYAESLGLVAERPVQGDVLLGQHGQKLMGKGRSRECIHGLLR